VARARWVPWAVGATAVGGAYLLLRGKSEADQPLTQPDIDTLMYEAYSDASFNRLIDELARDVPTPAIKRSYSGPLEILLEVRANWFERTFSPDITPDVRKTATKIASKLAETCPNAPRIARFDPSVVRVSKSDDGFRVRLVWPAYWGSTTTGPVRPVVRSCMETLTRTVDPKLGARLISFTASRL